MKKVLPLLLLVISLGLSQTTNAQVVTTVPCDWMNLTVNISDSNFVDIYHPGHYLTHPQAHNVFIGILLTQRVLLLLKKV